MHTQGRGNTVHDETCVGACVHACGAARLDIPRDKFHSVGKIRGVRGKAGVVGGQRERSNALHEIRVDTRIRGYIGHARREFFSRFLHVRPFRHAPHGITSIISLVAQYTGSTRPVVYD